MKFIHSHLEPFNYVQKLIIIIYSKWKLYNYVRIIRIK